MKQLLLATAFALAGSVAFAAPPEGRGPPEGKGPPGGFHGKESPEAREKRVACNRGWGAYAEQNQVDNKGGAARRAYMNGCLGGTITPPEPLADDAE